MILLNKGVNMNKYVKLNDNMNHLSLGNLFNAIKKNSINKSGAIQTEIFCTLFSVDNITDTTVNNYCTGYRAIGSNYKQIYINYRKHYETNKSVLIDTISNLITIMEGTITSDNTLDKINNNKTIINLCNNLTTYVKNDIYVPLDKKKKFLSYIDNKEYYYFICEILFFTILEKVQPLYTKDLVTETIEEILENTNMSVNDLRDYLEIKFKEGISFIPSLKELAKNNNPYALHELGNLEYNGMITGHSRYEEAYKYYRLSAEFNHPTSNWMLAHMIINKKIGNLNDDDIDLAWQYLKKAEALNSISAINTIGLCYLNGYTLDKKKNLNKAIEYFEKAASNNYVYAYNNLGKIYEEKKEYDKAIEYYSLSANKEDSWACNKLGLIYFNGIYTKKDVKKAFEYFSKGSEASITTLIPWNIYNLVNLFYLNGNSILGIEKNISKSLELLNQIKDFEPAYELFLYCYYELYLNNKSKEYLNKINYYLNILNNVLNDKKKNEIKNNIKRIHSHMIDIQL